MTNKAQTSYPGPENIWRHVFDNGLILLVYQHSAVESVVIEGLIRAGALVEKREQAGLANFVAEMLMRGTENRSFEQIFEELEAVGAAIQFGGGRHFTDFSGHSLTEDLDLVLSSLSDMLMNPIFPEKQIEAVRGEILTGLQIRANDTQQMAALKFREILYQDHPYAQSVDGYSDTIPALTREEMESFHETYYGPDDMILTVVGSAEPKKVIDRVEYFFGDWHPSARQMPPVPPAQRPPAMRRCQIDMPDKTQSDIVLGLPGPSRSAPDYLEASMANTVLGVFGMMGRLGEVIREEKGLAYYSFSRLQGGLGPSPWYVATGVSPAKVEQALESILYEIGRLMNEPVPHEELADCQAYRTGSLPVGLETIDGLAGIITDIELYGLGLDYLQLLPAKINRMTPQSIQAAAQKYLSTEQLAIAIAGPQS